MKYWVVYSYNDFFYIRHVHHRNKILIFTKKINFFLSFIANCIFLMLITVQAHENIKRTEWIRFRDNRRETVLKRTNKQTNKQTEQTNGTKRVNKQSKQTQRAKNSSFYKCDMRTARDEQQRMFFYFSNSITCFPHLAILFIFCSCLSFVKILAFVRR